MMPHLTTTAHGPDTFDEVLNDVTLLYLVGIIVTGLVLVAAVLWLFRHPTGHAYEQAPPLSMREVLVGAVLPLLLWPIGLPAVVHQLLRKRAAHQRLLRSGAPPAAPGACEPQASTTGTPESTLEAAP